MALLSFEIHNFRNIQNSPLTFSPGLNLVTGKNAAGKTSLLEAIYCLGRVRSFRASTSGQLIRYGQSAYRLVGRVGQWEGRGGMPIGIERRADGLQVHLDGQPVKRLSDLAGRFPVQVFSADTPTILNGGPRYRRQALDWALFHVEQAYREVWQRYSRALRQRNAALRAQQAPAEIRAWDAELLETAAEMHRFRSTYIEALKPYLVEEIECLLPGAEISVKYQPGWPANTALPEVLVQALEKDRARGHTRFGPHRADFSLLFDEHSISAHCSRGQQKAVTVGFLLAQVKLQRASEVPMGAFLLDDLSSELDAGHRARILGALRELDTQVFVTAIDDSAIDAADWRDARRFHVEHGNIRETR
ncbi:MAG: DNA replication/repair protein RecF [Gammaproteobacteria bacterium]|nr:DNA replication/repair protein RecF [Gammaproteobacteria bacterium]